MILPEGPTTYGRQALSDAQTLAQKIVASYGLSPIGITMYASPGFATDGQRSNYETSVDKIDEDLISKGMDGGMYQASDKTIGKIKRTAQDLVRDAYYDNIVSSSFLLSAGINMQGLQWLTYHSVRKSGKPWSNITQQFLVSFEFGKESTAGNMQVHQWKTFHSVKGKCQDMECYGDITKRFRVSF